MTPPRMTTAEPIVIEGHRPCELMSLNDRMHWRSKAALTKHWRKWAWAVSHQPSNRIVGPSIVTVELPVPDKRRRDPHNYHPTLKAIVDGLVDAGLWPDDTPEWVSVAEPRLIVRRDRVVRVLIDPRPPKEHEQA